jgi:hypothetical protein
VRRGWTTPYKYLSERKQRSVLLGAGVEDRVIYTGKADWPAFVRALRHGDEAVVAELRVFGSRKALGEGADEIHARGARLVDATHRVSVHPDTLALVQLTERIWAGERSMGGSKRARELSAKGIAAYRKKREEGRMPAADAETIWRDVEKYPLRSEAVAAMRGWSVMTAWRAFGAREPREEIGSG